MRRARLHSFKQQHQRGAVMVEFAIILPLLLFMFVGIVDFGLIIREHQILQNAAREGARMSVFQLYRIVSPGDANETAIKNRVVQYLQQENITIAAGDVTVNQNYPIDLGGVSAWGSQITVTYSRPLLVGSGWPFGPATLRGEVVFRNLY
jgi:Flp pilus assembly protein TadG